MELYYSPGACSLAPHIVSREAGLPIKLVKVDLGAKKTADGADYLKINPRGYVPALRLDDGKVMTEVAALVQYLADQNPKAGLAPKLGSAERYQLMELLTFISSEVHKGFSPLFDKDMPQAAKELITAKLLKRVAWLDKHLEGRDYLTGSTFTVADAYAFTILNWAGMLKVDLTPFANVRAFMARVAARPKVQEALREEGLLKTKAA